jgi:predicted SprT family Zn-dependent metalloprotease
MSRDGSTPATGGTRSERAPRTEDELLARAREYAATVGIDVDLDAVSWEVSRRAKRRAGACVYHGGRDAVAIRLTWAAYRSFGWDEFTDVIRHELVHAWEFLEYGESGHGERFREKADAVDASRHCPSFSVPRLQLLCTGTGCDWTVDRFKASKTVTAPEEHRCGECGSRYVVEHVATGERWRTGLGYDGARERIGEEW